MDDAGQVLGRMEYLPYGEAWNVDYQKENAPALYSTTAPKYNGQGQDTETGYYFYNARNYDSEIYRFVTADTIIDGANTLAGWNRYMYVHGNPVMYKDPSGHWGEGSEAFALADTMQAIGDFLGLTGKSVSANSGDQVTKTVVENTTGKSMDSTQTRITSRDKSPDLSVKMTIEGNIVEDGKIMGMRGTQTVTYHDKSGKVTEHTIKDMAWEDGYLFESETIYQYKVSNNKMYLSKDGKEWDELHIKIIDDKPKYGKPRVDPPVYMIIHLKCKWFEGEYELLGNTG